ncbi:MAG TPA: hypothetical protein VGM44_23040 [Polyangiaceae bacterium]|jgi:hypothetical protein
MKTRAVVLLSTLLATLSFAPRAHAANVDGPEINPFACQGDAEAVEDDRSVSQMVDELNKKLDPPVEPGDPATVRANKYCVIAQLKTRVGQSDAIDWYKKAIETNPDEPGYDMFAGKYYAGARGAKGQVLETAETYLYRALEKLDRLKAEHRYRDYHAIVEDHVRKQLLVLYQQDGLPLLPWKAYKQHPSGLNAPGVAVSEQFRISHDTRAALGANDTGGFTAEAGLFKVRTGRNPSARNEYDIARQPLRLGSDTQVNLRQTDIGEVSFLYSWERDYKAAITAFANPEGLNDIKVNIAGVEYKRVIPLYPAFDFMLDAKVTEVHRTGVVEDLADCEQDFPVYEFHPALSRFISSDKLTLSGTYVFMDIPDVTCGTYAQAQEYLRRRGRQITAVNLEYAIYSPLLLPSLGLGSLRPYRTPTRGLYLNAGYVNDNEVFGDVRVLNNTVFGGARLEGPGPYDLGFTEILNMASGTQVVSSGMEDPNADISGTILRSTVTVSRRLINPDETPGVPNSWGPFASHSLNWVFPLSYDAVLSSYKRFENFRAGTQLWWQVFGTGLGGATFLTTVGYDYEYFYHLNKHTHNVFLTARLGWRDL